MGNVFRRVFDSGAAGGSSNVPDPVNDNDFVAGSGGSWVARTLAEVKSILDLKSAAYTESADYAAAAHVHEGTYEPASADFTAKVSGASETAAGKVELATSEEAVEGTDTSRAVTPAGVAAAIAAGGGGGLTCFGSDDAVADDGTVSLPEMTVGGFGILVVGSDEERAFFTASATGEVNLMSYSDNITANEDADGRLCIGTSAASPIVVKNRLGSEKTVLLSIWYK